MKKFLLGGFASVAMFAGPAVAADMPVKARPAPPVVEYNWTGCYVGGNVGWKEGRFRERIDTPAAPTQPPVPAFNIPADFINFATSATSGVVGGQGGCRWQTSDRWVFGIEGDFDWQDLRRRDVVTRGQLNPLGITFVPDDIFSVRSRWQSSLRGTVGRSWDRWLGYVTGGVAFTNVRMDGTFIPTVTQGIPFPASAGADSQTLFGFTFGGGLAYALDQNWSIGAEYRYTRYQAENFALGPVAAFCANVGAVAPLIACTNVPATGHVGLRTSELLLKANYRFSGP